MEYALRCNANVHMMIQRRAKAAGPHTKISFYSFRAAHTATHFQNGVKSEIAQQGMNPHVPPSFAIAAATTVISNAHLQVRVFYLAPVSNGPRSLAGAVLPFMG